MPPPDTSIGEYPFDPEFQIRVVSAALVDRTFVARNQHVFKSEYFSDAAARDMAAVVLDFFHQHRTAPSRSLFAHVVGEEAKRRGLKPAVAAQWRAAAEAAVAVPAADAEYAAKRVEDWARSQVMGQVAMRIAGLYEDSQRDGRPRTDEMVEIVRDAGARLTRPAADWLSYFDDAVPRVYVDHRATKVTTGYPTLDEALDGGVDPGEFLVFLAPPSGGKTSLLVGVARGMLLHRLRPLVVTNEVSARKWAQRVDRAVSGLTREEIAASPRVALKRIERVRQGGRMIIKGYPSGQATVADLDALVEAVKDQENFVPDALIVDLADELRVSGEEYRLGTIDNYRKLRALGQRHAFPMFSASQAGRGAEGKAVVNMRDFAEAYGKAAVVDIAIAACQTEEEAAMRPYPLTRLFGAKYREGKRRFTLPYVFRADRGIIVPAPDGYAPDGETEAAYGATA